MSNDYAIWLNKVVPCPQLEKLEPNQNVKDDLSELMIEGMDSTIGELIG